MKIEGAIAIITGGTGTMGTEIAAQLSANGATAVRFDIGERSDDTVPCDVSDADAVDVAFAETIERFGVPTILVNSAGVSGGRAPWASDVLSGSERGGTNEDWRTVLSPIEAWRAVFDVNVLGVVQTSRAFAREAFRRGLSGAIVNITSIGGSVLAEPELAAYCASKAAADMITRIAAVDFGPLGIRVNAVAPGMMETRMKVSGVAPAVPRRGDPPNIVERAAAVTPLEQRPAHASDVADAVLALLRTDFVTGQIVHVDGGLMLRSLSKS
jgi:NAD(P)-dependent dehydrogenase (short-subunit alcohol dehydrogenase family)